MSKGHSAWTQVTHQTPRQKVNGKRVGVGEERCEWLPLAEGQSTNVVAGSSCGDRVEFIESGCTEHVENECKLVVIVTAREQWLAGEHLSQNAAN